MKILLASNGTFVTEKGYELFGIPKNEIRIGFIITASKGKEDLTYIYRHITQMKDKGFYFEEFDIENKSEEEILDFFADKNIVSVSGGSNSYLLKVVREVKFDIILEKLFKNGLQYVGSSAGAYLMCPILEPSLWGHGETDFGLQDFRALNYVPFLLKVHYKDEQKEEISDKMKTLKYPLRILRDGQGIIVEDGKYTFVGDGEEVILK